MVVLTVNTEEGPRNLYMDGKLHRSLTQKVLPGVKDKDKDFVMIVDGPEGSGKSVMSMQIAIILDPTFCLDRVCMTPEEFTRAILRAKKGQCVVYDEAFTGLSSRQSLTEINRIIVSLMMEMRQKNLFVLIVMPTFFLLDKYVALFRAKGLIHVYTHRGKRGRWCYFNNKKKKLLYLKGKKLYSYGWPKSRFHGVFRDQYMVNELEYRKKKSNALKKKSGLTKATIYLEQRNILIWILSKTFKMSGDGIANECRKLGFKIGKSMINKVLMAKRDELNRISEYEAEEKAVLVPEKEAESNKIIDEVPEKEESMPEEDDLMPDLDEEAEDRPETDDFD